MYSVKKNYILRKTEDSENWTLSWNGGNRIRHLQIKEENEKYHLEHQLTSFDLMSDLVAFYMSFNRSRSLYLLQGLTNSNLTDDMQEKRLSMSKKKDPRTLPSFHGVMSSQVK